jgi:hypothetical protein
VQWEPRGQTGMATKITCACRGYANSSQNGGHFKQGYLPLSVTKLGVLATVYCKIYALLRKNSDYLPEQH